MNKKNLIISVAGLLIIIAISAGTYYLVTNSNKVDYRTIAVGRADISRAINASGQIKPAEAVQLAFEVSGKTTAVNVKVGDTVKAGQIIATVDNSIAATQVAAAKANLDAASAQYDQVKNGARPEDLSIKATELDTAGQTMANIYDSSIVAISDAYAKADDAVKNNTDSMFLNPNTDYPKLVFLTTDSQLQVSAEAQRQQVNNDLKNWQAELSDLNSAKDVAKIDSELSKSAQYLSDVRQYLNTCFDLVTASVNLNAATLSAYKTALNVSRTETTAATSGINASLQSIANQKIQIDRIQKQYDLLKTGARVEDINAASARVAQARAAYETASVQAGKAVLRSPIDGTVSLAQPKVGEMAVAGQPAFAINSNAKYQIEILLSQADVYRVKVGDSATITIDAFSGKTYDAKIISVDPSPTSANGNSGYKTKLELSSDYPEIKDGMTASVTINIDKISNALALPEYAVSRQDNSYFVRLPDGQKIQVQVGLRGDDGKLEIISGLSEGQKVTVIGQ